MEPRRATADPIELKLEIDDANEPKPEEDNRPAINPCIDVLGDPVIRLIAPIAPVA